VTPRCRLAILASHPIQYFTPLYRRLTIQPALDVDVLYCRDYGVRPRYDRNFGRTVVWDTDQLSGYNSRFLWNASPITDTFNPLHAVNPGAFTAMLRGYDALWVNGYLYPSNWIAIAGARLRGTKVLVRSELRPDGPMDGARGRVRNALLRHVVRSSDALLYIGEENRAAYERYGARPEQLFFTPYSVDVEAIRAASALDPAERLAARDALGIPRDRIVVLTVGKLTDVKDPFALLDVCADPRIASRIHGLCVGSGPLEPSLRERARGMSNVTFTGFVNQSELPRMYGLADIFLMPSLRETWGLVLNEAMAAGLPAVVSAGVGAVPDLITPGETGLVVPVRDRARLLDAVRTLVDDPALRTSMGRAAAARSERYSYDATTAGVLSALESLGVYSPGATSLPRAHDVAVAGR
jgi:glycosyltransferase involved in cell wall biosynthesis